MNENVLKIIEQLGYNVETDGVNLHIYDKNSQELKKEIVLNEVYNGVNYISDNGQVIHFDNNDFMEIRVDDNTRIVTHNLSNNCNYDSISIYFGPSNLYDFVITFDVYKNSNSSCINITAYENTAFSLNENYFIREFSINGNNNGAIISLFNEDVRHLSIIECTKEVYLGLVIRFINSITDEKIKKDIERGFNIIAPAFIAIISDLADQNNKSLSRNRK